MMGVLSLASRSWLAVAVSVALLVFGGVTAPPSLAQQKLPPAQDKPVDADDWDTFIPLGGGWQTYINTRFGVRFDYPAHVFAVEPPPANGGGRSFVATDASLLIYASHNTLEETPASMKSGLSGSEGYEQVTYSPSGADWLVLSGFRGETIFYEKYIFAGGVISALVMEYPTARKPAYAPMVERIEDSFTPGHSD